MKITKTADKVRNLEMQRRLANIGCDRCPSCGENKTDFDYIKETGYYSSNKGIMKYGVRHTLKRVGLFKSVLCCIDSYKCNTCGVTWESEPYPVE